MKKNTLLESIKRIHQIIGIEPKIVMESEISEMSNPISQEGAKLLAKFFTNLEKSLVIGSKSYTKQQVTGIIRKVGTAALNAEEKAVMQTLTKEAIAANRGLIKNISQEIYGEIQKLSQRQLRSKYYSETKRALEEIVPDAEIGKIFKQVDDKMKPSTSSSSSGGQGLKPNRNRAPKPGEIPDDADQIISITAKSSPEAAAYMKTVDLFGLDEKVTKMIKLQYPNYFDKTPTELLEEATKLAAQLNEKEYGWAKRLTARLLKTDINKLGKNSAKVILWVTILALLGTVAGIGFKIKNWVESKTGTSFWDIFGSDTDSGSSSGGSGKPKLN
jgi:hypothetical protein